MGIDLPLVDEDFSRRKTAKRPLLFKIFHSLFLPQGKMTKEKFPGSGKMKGRAGWGNNDAEIQKIQ